MSAIETPRNAAATGVVLVMNAEPAQSVWRRVFSAVQHLGLRAVEAEPTVSLTEAVARHNPMAVLAGWNRKVADAVRRLKRDSDRTRLPVLAVSVEPTLEEVATMIDDGFEDCLRERTPDVLLTARIGTAIRSKYMYDSVIKLAEEGSHRDPLSGLWNRRYLQKTLNAEIARVRVVGGTLALVAFDIDFFKRINDTYGHPSGDKVLQATAMALHEVIRVGDTLARVGGEEFTLLLPGAGREDALAVARRAAESQKRRMAGMGWLPFGLTLSTGVAVFPTDANSAADLVAAADCALYQAKRVGRNRIESVRWKPFELRTGEEIEFVGLAGDWNGWSPEKAPLSMVASGDGFRHWQGLVLVPTGTIRYKLLAVGPAGKRTWLHDADNPGKEPDEFGGWNSVMEIPGY